MKIVFCALVFVLSAFANADQPGTGQGHMQPPPLQQEVISFMAAFDMITCVKVQDQQHTERYECENNGAFENISLKLEKMSEQGDVLYARTSFEKDVSGLKHSGGISVVRAVDEQYGPYYGFFMNDSLTGQSTHYANVDVFTESPATLDAVILIGERVQVSETEVKMPYIMIAPMGMKHSIVRSKIMRAARARLQ